MNQTTWLTERDLGVVKQWVTDAQNCSGNKFVLVCECGLASMNEIRQMLPKNLVELNRNQLSLKMNHPPKSPRLYLLTSVPSSIQQSRLSSWMKRPGNGVVIFVEKFDQTELDWRDGSGMQLRHEVISGPQSEEDD